MENKNIKIVAIDDNKDNLFTLKVLIKEQFPNIDVITALNGKKGIELAKKENPHLILLDILMPEMDGFEVCKKLKESKKLCDIPVVFVTAFGAKESRIKALNCGVEGFLTKPIDESELTAQINAMLKIRFSTIHKQNEKERLEILVAERTKNLKDELIRRKQTEESLYESEEINRSITQTAADAIISINSEGLVIAWNNAAEKIFGYTSSEMMGKILTKIIPTQNRKKHNQGVFRFKNGGKEKLIGKTIVIDALRKDGTEFPIELSLSSWISANNKKYFTSIIRDITARKEKETTLLQFRYAMSSSSDMMAMLNEKFKYQLANDAYCKNLNITAQELIGRTPSEIFGKEFFEKKMLPHAIRCMKSEVQVNYKTWFNFPSLGEKFMEITYYPYYGNGEKVVGFVVNARDITSQKKVERELVKAKDKAEENEQRISSIYDTVGDVIFHIKVESDKFRFISVNKEFLKATGLKESMIIGKLANEIIPANSLSMVLENYKKAINEKKTVRWIETSNYPTGQLIGQVSISPIFNDKGEATFLVGSVHDITELKEGERKLLLAKEKAEESDRLKTEFLNNMSHEIRTPMNGILGFSDMLSDPDLSVGKRANFIKIIQSSTNQLLQVIDDILEISRLGTQQVSVEEESVCINDLLLELFSIFDIKAKENKTPLYLKKTLSDKQSYIFVDKAKLIKILSNLLDNALKFTNYGFVEFGYHLKNYELELYIKDTGIGIEQANHELIFERFSQAEKDLTKKVGGLGLGLSIAKENTELIGGNIRLESKIDEGSTFFVTIPYKTVYKENKPNLEGADDQNEFTILIAEDEEVNYLYLETLLVDIFDLECKIVHVKNGVEAVEACKENKAIDLVLMDLKMPVLNGYEATEQIRAFNSKLPIIAQTAYSTSEERKQAIAAGCDDFLIKPIDKESLKEVIDKYLIKKIGI